MYKWYECGFDVASRFLLLHICFCSAFVASLLYWNSFLPHATVAATTNQPATFPYNNKPWQHTIKKAKTMLIPSATNTTKTANNWSLVSATRNSGKFYFTCVVLWLFIQLLFSHVCPYLHASAFLVANFVVVVWFTFSICLYLPLCSPHRNPPPHYRFITINKVGVACHELDLPRFPLSNSHILSSRLSSVVSHFPPSNVFATTTNLC